ncbi:hypothetical protein GQ43DRAFT_468025 [Delitschia confertaspora ATCC 74209]|uniref:Uncharacterized protein n=1 Tax=Delitschia confertaspora ATCC 74209 TaxID=1513339 RepID=A0A9P4MZQ9_9PLEO|nr:hypothetical protein GQ43DRAFT_468025 [Delitschia confertaspora ATCC 74209]
MSAASASLGVHEDHSDHAIVLALDQLQFRPVNRAQVTTSFSLRAIRYVTRNDTLALSLDRLTLNLPACGPTMSLSFSRYVADISGSMLDLDLGPLVLPEARVFTTSLGSSRLVRDVSRTHAVDLRFGWLAVPAPSLRQTGPSSSLRVVPDTSIDGTLDLDLSQSIRHIFLGKVLGTPTIAGARNYHHCHPIPQYYGNRFRRLTIRTACLLPPRLVGSHQVFRERLSEVAAMDVESGKYFLKDTKLSSKLEIHDALQALEPNAAEVHKLVEEKLPCRAPSLPTQNFRTG